MQEVRPGDELSRLHALRDYQILDTPPEDVFDDFTRLAAYICGTPIALISLIDSDRQWFKSKVGLEVAETPRDISFCTHAIQQEGVFLVPDAAADIRFADNPLVTGETNMQFYAGAPLVTPQGEAIGSLCVIDHQARTLTAEQQSALQSLSRQVIVQLELRRQLQEQKQSEKNLRISETRKAAILESSLDSIITIDQNGCVVEWNAAAEWTFGYLADEAVGQDISTLIVPPSLRGAHRKGMAHFLATGEGPALGKRIEISAMRVDGSEFMVELAITPILLEGEILFTACLRDISERCRTEEALRLAHEELETRVAERTAELFQSNLAQRESEERYRSLVESSPEGILVYSDSRVVYANPAAAVMLAASCPEDLLGRPFLDFIPSGDHAPARERVHRCQEENQPSGLDRQRYVRLDGQVIDVEVVSTSLIFQGQRADQATIRDISERIQSEAQIIALNTDLAHAYEATIEGWSRALDLRDHETEGHSQRVTELTLRLAQEIGMTGEELVHVRRGALLHDIGKMGVPDSILLKPGPLTGDEWAVMRRHPVLAREMLQPITFLQTALDIPGSHHEKWDGSGYPCGLVGEDIPLAARLFAIVDVWDALRSDRPYRKAWTEERVLNHLCSLSGSHFDPMIVGTFMALMARDTHGTGHKGFLVN